MNNEQANSLYAAIINLPIPHEPKIPSDAGVMLVYKIGHRDARHAAAELVAASASVPEGFVIAPHFRGYAHLGTCQYIVCHSGPAQPAELIIHLASEADREGRAIGEYEGIGKDVVEAEEMAVRIRFENPESLDVLENQLRMMRTLHFPESVAASVGAQVAPSEPVAGEVLYQWRARHSDQWHDTNPAMIENMRKQIDADRYVFRTLCTAPVPAPATVDSASPATVSEAERVLAQVRKYAYDLNTKAIQDGFAGDESAFEILEILDVTSIASPATPVVDSDAVLSEAINAASGITCLERDPADQYKSVYRSVMAVKRDILNAIEALKGKAAPAAQAAEPPQVIIMGGTMELCQRDKDGLFKAVKGTGPVQTPSGWQVALTTPAAVPPTEWKPMYGDEAPSEWLHPDARALMSAVPQDTQQVDDSSARKA